MAKRRRKTSSGALLWVVVIFFLIAIVRNCVNPPVNRGSSRSSTGNTTNNNISEPSSTYTVSPSPTEALTPKTTLSPAATITRLRMPGNCATAVAMGLTAEQAAQWSHLDRDHDGVACYGD